MDARPTNRRNMGRNREVRTVRRWYVLIGVLMVSLAGTVSCQNSETIGYWSKPDSENTDTDSETDSDSTTSDSATEDEDSATATDSETEEDSGSETETLSGDTEDTDTEDTVESSDSFDSFDSDSTDSDTGEDTSPPYDRVLFTPSVTDAPEDPLLVEPENNTLGLPGGWFPFPFPPAGPTWAMGYFNDDGDICLRGEVAQWSGNPMEKPYAGIGIGFCHDPDISYLSYSINDCVYPTPHENEFNFVGVSFYLEGTFDSDDMQMAVVWPGFQFAFTAEIDAATDAATDYLFRELPGYSDNWPLNDIYTVQIQVDSSMNHPIEYDFCIKDFELLVTWK